MDKEKRAGSNTAKRTLKAAKLKRGPGRPFKKGDPRINKNGQISNKRIGFNKALRELIIDEGEKKAQGKGEKGKIVNLKKVEWLVKSVWQKAIAGESWAVQFISEKVEGKVTQPFEGTLTAMLSMTDMRNSMKDYDGNGSDKQ